MSDPFKSIQIRVLLPGAGGPYSFLCEDEFDNWEEATDTALDLQRANSLVVFTVEDREVEGDGLADAEGHPPVGPSSS